MRPNLVAYEFVVGAGYSNGRKNIKNNVQCVGERCSVTSYIRHTYHGCQSPLLILSILIVLCVHGSICREGGCGGSTPAGKTATPAGEHLQKCNRGRILTPAVNYGDKRSASR